MALSNTEKQSAFRQRMKEQGYVRREFWIKGDPLAELEADREAAIRQHQQEKDPEARAFAAGQVDGLCHALQRLYALFGTREG